MANDYYTRTYDFDEHALARGAEIKAELDALVSAFDLTQTNMSDYQTQSAASAASALASKNAAAVSENNAANSAASALSAASQNLTAISTTQTGTIVAVNTYASTKDTDAGAWREKTGLSPMLCIEATSTTVIIYNGADVTTPQVAQITGLTGITCVTAINGRIYVGHASGVSVYDALNSFALLITYSTSSTPALVANTVQSIAATVLPTAPIDNNTGLPVPTIWIGTLSGMSRMADDNTVSNWTESGSIDDVYNVGISGDYVYFATDNTTSNKYILVFPVTSALSASLYTSTTYQHYTGAIADSWLSTKTPLHYGGVNSQVQDIAKNAIASNRSLTLLQPNTTNWGQGLHATITKDFNSGYQFGDIRGAWLCQGAAETLTSTDLVTGDSSTFTTGIGDWSITNPYLTGDSSIAALSGKLEVTALGLSSSIAASASLALTCVVGKTYTVRADLERLTGRGSPNLWVYGNSSAAVSQLTVATVTTTYTFVATEITQILILYEGNVSETAGLAFRADNITCKLAEPDVSYKNNALTIVGSIVKSPVNTGCDLMGYSGFSASGYFIQAYNSALDYGVQAFSIRFWLKCVATVNKELIFARDSVVTAQRFKLEISATTSVLSFTVSDNTTTRTATSTDAIDDDVWHFYECIYDGAGGVYIYRDGISTAFASATGSTLLTLNNSSAIFVVGASVTATNPLASGTLALFHISGGAPTTAQIKSVYEKEKRNFVPGTKCLLPGTSNDVKSLDYDAPTDTYHYVTGDYYGAHKGLVRVDSAAGVYTSISASNGAIIKGA